MHLWLGVESGERGDFSLCWNSIVEHQSKRWNGGALDRNNSMSDDDEGASGKGWKEWRLERSFGLYMDGHSTPATFCLRRMG